MVAGLPALLAARKQSKHIHIPCVFNIFLFWFSHLVGMRTIGSRFLGHLWISHCCFFHMAAPMVIAPPPKREAAAEPVGPVVVPPPHKCEVVHRCECEVASPLKIWKPEMLLDPANYSMPDRCVPDILNPSRWTESKSKPCPPPMSLVPSKQWGDGSYVLAVRCLDPLSMTTWERLEKNKRKSWLMMDEDQD